MRPSKKTDILEAAIHIIGEKGGLDALTFDSLAEASGLSKSGLIYHFPSRQQLIIAVHQHLADLWEEELCTIAGAPATELTPEARLRAFVCTMAHSANRADLVCALNIAQEPEAAEAWESVMRRWAPNPAQVEDDHAARTAYLVQLLAEGLWLHDHVNATPLTPGQRDALTEAVLNLIPTGKH
ncbi:TetR/AcrR family transcriptional regulator [Corynebacterium spheniscorum]|uniref:Transcriptional regulator, TetR family n=1 Tax=Corynebacterium spheniscorum TaxID=185761 RepID=A0A1I2UDF7_9CORY|nr:TetR family transcriptional regulator [Corynebacterium spheniscorum]KAA8720744.1 TetR family transcriptional regulator [Corynebacterium spheniscorum]SFG72876.1 transcriptional regulator, TetR family [Corynebacterium spheniscorum]